MQVGWLRVWDRDQVMRAPRDAIGTNLQSMQRAPRFGRSQRDRRSECNVQRRRTYNTGPQPVRHQTTLTLLAALTYLKHITKHQELYLIMKLVAVLASMLLGCIASVHAIPIEDTGLSSRGQTVRKHTTNRELAELGLRSSTQTTNDDIASHENVCDNSPRVPERS